MDYFKARYFCIAFYSDADEAEIRSYLSRVLEMGKNLSLRIDAMVYGDGMAVKKYRRRRFAPEKLNEFVSRAQSEKRKELGIYVTSKDFSATEAPSLIANAHFAFGQTLGGKEIQESPTSFIIIAARMDTLEAKILELHAQTEMPFILRGGCWESRPYVLDGTAIEWAFKSYPVARRACSLSQWNPKFDMEFA